jgi:hypothetical protein
LGPLRSRSAAALPAKNKDCMGALAFQQVTCLAA